MTGKRNGMAVHLRDMIRAEFGEQNSGFQSIWCLSHRLNLVVRDFESVDHIKDVLKFADWFSSKRKAVACKKWLSETRPDNHFKKIHKPSETMWCFYKDVLNALLTQPDEVDAFLIEDQDFIAFRRTTWNCLGEIRPGLTARFLGNPFVHSLFRFALFILEKKQRQFQTTRTIHVDPNCLDIHQTTQRRV